MALLIGEKGHLTSGICIDTNDIMLYIYIYIYICRYMYMNVCIQNSKCGHSFSIIKQHSFLCVKYCYECFIFYILHKDIRNITKFNDIRLTKKL